MYVRFCFLCAQCSKKYKDQADHRLFCCVFMSYVKKGKEVYNPLFMHTLQHLVLFIMML